MANEIFTSEKERNRLTVQGVLIGSYEKPVYTAVLRGKKSLCVLDIGCNDGSRTVARFGNRAVKHVVGLEYHPSLVKAANEKYQNEKYVFYDMDVESSELNGSLGQIMEAREIDGFDIISMSFVLTHLKNPLRLLKRLKPFLKAGGTIVITDSDDGYSMMNPDEAGFLKKNLELTEKDRFAGKRDLGRTIPKLLEDSGYTNITIHTTAIWAASGETEKKQRMFETYYSYLPEDYEYLAREQPENEEYAKSLLWLSENHIKFEAAFTGPDTEAACGTVIVTAENR